MSEDIAREFEPVTDENEIEFIARLRYVCWCCYRLGVISLLDSWDTDKVDLYDYRDTMCSDFDWDAPEENIENLMDGVRFLESRPGLTPEHNHMNWMVNMARKGWGYGPVKNPKKKTHPDMVPYDELPTVEKAKDEMDVNAQKKAKELLKFFKERFSDG